MKIIVARFLSVAIFGSSISLIACQKKKFAAKTRGDIPPSSQTTLRAENLQCEYLVDPLGIDTAQPRFSWKLIDADQTRGQKQAAW